MSGAMLESLIEINSIRIILALSMLGYASYTDITKREIHDFIWIIFGILAVGLIFVEPNMDTILLQVGISLIVAPIVLIVWRLGLFGGADAFAIIVLAALAPQITLSENIVTPFTVLTNTIILSIIPMFVNLSRNLIQLARKENIFDGFTETKSRRILALFIGYRAKNPKYGFSIERKAGKKKRLNLSLQHAEYTQFCTQPDTWITPGIPYMIFILAGFVTQIFYGDIIFNFISKIAS